MVRKRTLETDLPRRVGLALRQRRESLDLTQEQFSELVGMQTENYQRLEYGRVNFTLATLERLSRGLGAHPSEILCHAEALPAELLER